ncbi:MAG: hypothetical protein LW853_04880 [Rickettsiales bacterium]|jgi:hypothetical protein|nr:hypothetical protein [Rickettsiales bacterium]
MIQKVGYTAPTAATARTQRTRRKGEVSGSSFIDALENVSGVEEAASVDAAAPVTAAASMVGLLGIQEISADEANRKRQVKRGRVTLEALENLRDALIIGRLSLATVRELEQIVAEKREQISDPVLSGILDEIELRAAVEMAKLERAGIQR